MKRIATGIAAASVLMLGGCIIIDADEVDSHYDYDSSWGSVYAADVGLDAISVTVRDNGCTTKDFFEVDIDGDDELEFEIGFDRIREDHCKAYNPAGKRLTWSFAELGIPAGADVSVENQVRRR
jgi:hypothetical protein